ncbi:MAG: hypothetical protein EOP63_04930 [Sphingomonadales bacterium]|nr:MAG: hypothetical protein EOP63_04930 [Sphingomonadales bacterium]
MPFSKDFALCAVLIGFAVAACGAETDAKEDPRATAQSGGTAGTPMASSPLALPIQQGLYIDQVQQGNCGAATAVFVYDGAAIGTIESGISNTPNGTFSSFEKITRLGAKGLDPEFAANSKGYIIVWAGEQARGFPSLALKPGKSGGFVRITTSGNAIISFDESPYDKCGFTQLSPQMQAAVRVESASLAGGPPPSGAAPAPAGKIAFPPIEKGYYAINMSCAQAVADGGDMIAYFDEKRFGAWDGFAEIQGFESLGGNRYRVNDRSQDENGKWTSGNFVMVVNGRTSFTREEDGVRHNFCPASQISANIKQDLG